MPPPAEALLREALAGVALRAQGLVVESVWASGCKVLCLSVLGGDEGLRLKSSGLQRVMIWTVRPCSDLGDALGVPRFFFLPNVPKERWVSVM